MHKMIILMGSCEFSFIWSLFIWSRPDGLSGRYSSGRDQMNDQKEIGLHSAFFDAPHRR